MTWVWWISISAGQGVRVWESAITHSCSSLPQIDCPHLRGKFSVIKECRLYLGDASLLTWRWPPSLQIVSKFAIIGDQNKHSVWYQMKPFENWSFRQWLLTNAAKTHIYDRQHPHKVLICEWILAHMIRKLEQKLKGRSIQMVLYVTTRCHYCSELENIITPQIFTVHTHEHFYKHRVNSQAPSYTLMVFKVPTHKGIVL